MKSELNWRNFKFLLEIQKYWVYPLRRTLPSYIPISIQSHRFLFGLHSIAQPICIQPLPYVQHSPSISYSLYFSTPSPIDLHSNVYPFLSKRICLTLCSSLQPVIDPRPANNKKSKLLASPPYCTLVRPPPRSDTCTKQNTQKATSLNAYISALFCPRSNCSSAPSCRCPKLASSTCTRKRQAGIWTRVQANLRKQEQIKTRV